MLVFGHEELGLVSSVDYKLGLTEEQTYTAIYKAVAKLVETKNPDNLRGRIDAMYKKLYSDLIPIVIGKMKEQLESGEICFKLNGDQSEISWYQSINFDKYPVLTPSSEQVFFNEEENIYYNLINGVPVGINEVKSAEPEVQTGIYNLAGQRLEKMHKGINIVNGKKIFVK